MYQRILVPVDGSDTAGSGLAEAIRLAADQHAQVRLVYVLSDAYLDPLVLHGVMTPDPVEELRTKAQAVLNSGAKEAHDAGVGAETAILEHHRYEIGDAIIKEAVRWQSDLIVMGTHGRRGIARTVLGSDAEYVVRHTPVPVLLVRA